MTGIAGIGAIDMISRLAAGYSSVMTASTGTQYFIMIHRICRYRRPWSWCGLMTGFAKVRSRNMRW